MIILEACNIYLPRIIVILGRNMLSLIFYMGIYYYGDLHISI
nr:MAG TPA: hypothetical protein [Caudoviricetes sp.]